MKVWRASALIILCCFALGAAAGCAYSGTGSAAEGSAVPAEKEVVTLRIFSPYTESNSDAVGVAFREAVAQAEKAFPDYELINEAINTETYKTKLYLYMASNETPDIFFTWSDGYFEPIVENGKALRLNDYITNAADPADDDRYAIFVKDGNVYGMALTYWYCVFYYNQALFDQYSLTVPGTWDELLSVCRTFAENDVLPISCGFKDIWPAHQFVNQLMLQLMGAERYRNIAAGTEQCSFDEMFLIGQYLRELMDAGAFGNDAGLIGNDESVTIFGNGGAAMTFAGNIHTLTLMESPAADDIRVTRLPLTEACLYPEDYIGKVSNGLAVSASSGHPGEAVEVMRYLTSHTASNSRLLSPWTLFDTRFFPMLSEVEELVAGGRDFGNNYDVLLTGDTKDAYLNAVYAFFMGQTDTEEFARDMVGILNREQ